MHVKRTLFSGIQTEFNVLIAERVWQTIGLIDFLNEVKFYGKAFHTNGRYRRLVTNSLKRLARYMPAVKEVFKKRNLF